MMQMHFMARSMFNFEQELLVHRFEVLTWELNYCLFQPIMSFGCRIFLQQMIGPEFDVLPLMHPIGYPQSMLMDIKNMFGCGNTALYLSSPQRQYYQYVDSCFENWMTKTIEYHENRYF